MCRVWSRERRCSVRRWWRRDRKIRRGRLYRRAALAAARALDALLAAGTDLGPLMGVPVAVMDLFAVEGLPTHAGSKLDLSDVIGSEGSFVKRLKRAGCILLGKTKTVEFALGTDWVRGPLPEA
ncbi:MAG: hypothetical protein IH786_01580 [Proteobacteria bacterium]|nr:hypothetical protein [Pseudomonadota bacterium]